MPRRLSLLASAGPIPLRSVSLAGSVFKQRESILIQQDDGIGFNEHISW